MKARILLLTVIICNTLMATAQKMGPAGPHLLVYKTKKNYSKLVPVILSEDKTKIVSYPDPADVKKKGKSMQPTSLHGKYLLDNYGISPNTAYLGITYSNYAAMKTTPGIDELYKKIQEKNPLTTLYDCGLRSSYKSPVRQLNRLIDKKWLADSCTVVNLKK